MGDDGSCVDASSPIMEQQPTISGYLQRAVKNSAYIRL